MVNCDCRLAVLPIIAFGILLLGIQPPIAANGPQVKKSFTTKRFQELADQIKPVKNRKELIHFKNISTEIIDLEIASKKQDEAAWRRQRTQKLRLWLRLDGTLRKSVDPKWDPEDVPQRNIAPPEGPYPAGVDPSAIKDPKLRKQYEKAIQENADKAERHNLQLGLQRLEKSWPKELYIFVRSDFSDSPEDQQELKKIMREEVKDKEQREKLTQGFAELDKRYDVIGRALFKKKK